MHLKIALEVSGKSSENNKSSTLPKAVFHSKFKQAMDNQINFQIQNVSRRLLFAAHGDAPAGMVDRRPVAGEMGGQATNPSPSCFSCQAGGGAPWDTHRGPSPKAGPMLWTRTAGGPRVGVWVDISWPSEAQLTDDGFSTGEF